MEQPKLPPITKESPQEPGQIKDAEPPQRTPELFKEPLVSAGRTAEPVNNPVAVRNHSSEAATQHMPPKELPIEPKLQPRIPDSIKQAMVHSYRAVELAGGPVVGRPVVEAPLIEEVPVEYQPVSPDTSYIPRLRLLDIEAETIFNAEEVQPEEPARQEETFGTNPLPSTRERPADIIPIQEEILTELSNTLEIETPQNQTGRAEAILLGQRWWGGDLDQPTVSLAGMAELELEPSDTYIETPEPYVVLQEAADRQLATIAAETGLMAEPLIIAEYDEEYMIEPLEFVSDEEVIAEPLAGIETNEECVTEQAHIFSLNPEKTDSAVEPAGAARFELVSTTDTFQVPEGISEAQVMVSAEEVEEAFGQLAVLRELAPEPQSAVLEDTETHKSSVIEDETGAEIENTVAGSFEAYVAALPESEEPITLDVIQHSIDVQPLEETLEEFAELLSKPASEQEVKVLKRVTEQIESVTTVWSAGSITGKKIQITPELTEKLLVVLKTLGYQRPGEMLVGFVAQYDLEYLLEALEYLCRVNNGYGTYEFNPAFVVPSSDGCEDGQRLRLGKLLFGIIHAATSIYSTPASSV